MVCRWFLSLQIYKGIIKGLQSKSFEKGRWFWGEGSAREEDGEGKGSGLDFQNEEEEVRGGIARGWGLFFFFLKKEELFFLSFFNKLLLR